MEWNDGIWNDNRHFKACRKCVAPKRHPGCHEHCEEYAADKAAYEAVKTKLIEERDTDAAIKAGYNRVNRFYRINRKGTYSENHD